MTPTAKPILACSADLTPFPAVRSKLESAFDVRYVQATPEAIMETISDAEVYYASLAVRIDRPILNRAKHLKAIGTASTGRDHIDLECADQQGIAVLSLKDDRELLDKITATAELTWALILAASRRLPAACYAAQNGLWGRDAFRGHQIAYKTLGIIGCGRLGTMVSQYGLAFRMQVLGCDVNPDISLPGVEMVGYQELLRRSDIISIHIHPTPENRHYVNQEFINQIKAGAVLVNTSRGAIVDETALLDALELGRLSAAGVDVIDGEWNDDLSRHPMIVYARTHDNLIITPHIGGVTYESQEMAYMAAAEKLIEYFIKINDPTAISPKVGKRGV